MTRPWIGFVAGASGLLVLMLSVRHFHSSDAGTPAVTHAQDDITSVFEKQESARSGWIARPGTGSGQNAGSTTGSHAVGAHGFSTSDDTEDANDGGGGGPTVIGGSGGANGGGANVRSAQYAGAGSVQANGAIPAMPVPFEGAKPLGPGAVGGTGPGASGNPAVAGSANDPTKDTPGENGLVLSLLNSSTTPDKGDTTPLVEQGVSCQSGGCNFSTDSQFALPDAGNLSGEQGSLSFCLQPDWNGSDPGDASLVQLRTPNLWENRMQIFKNGRYMRLILTPNTGLETGGSTDIMNWQSGQQHPIAATWGPDPTTGQNMVSFYVDGQMVSQQPYDGQFDVPSQTPLYIGSDMPQGGPGAGGTLSNFQGYNQPLNPQTIAGLASGCAPQ